MKLTAFFKGLPRMTAGTVRAGRAVIADANKTVDTLTVTTLVATTFNTVTPSIGGVAVTATAAEINKLAGVTGGTVTASKALVTDANKDLASLRYIRKVLDVPARGAPVTDSTAGALTIAASTVLVGKLLRDPNGAGRTDVLPTAALLVAALPGAAVGDELFLYIVNCADAAETITISAGAGGAFDALQVAGTRIIPQNTSRLISIRLTNVTALSEAYTVLM